MKRVASYIGSDTFCLTYGDGLGDVDITRCVEHHKAMGALATVTAVRPPSRFGALDVDGGYVRNFCEKPSGDETLDGADDRTSAQAGTAGNVRLRGPSHAVPGVPVENNPNLHIYGTDGCHG